MSVFRPPNPQPPWSPQQPWWRRVFGGDNPLTWSLPIGRYWGIAVRISLIYVVWMAFQVGSAASQSGALGFAQQAFVVGALFIIVLMHEFGHCFACRFVGGDADEVLMWPLGGLAFCRPPHHWRASFITTAGGPVVNVALVPVFAGALLILGQPAGALFFSPLNITSGWSALDYGAAPIPAMALQLLFWTYTANWALLLFNVVLPMYPMDGGRLMQALLWRSMGYRRSMSISTMVGLVVAATLGLFALTTGSMVLLGIAIFGGFTCYSERQRLAYLAPEPEGVETWQQGAVGPVGDTPDAARVTERRRKEAEAARKAREVEGQELDRILAKIKDRGMGSLTSTEQTFLRRTREKMQQH